MLMFLVDVVNGKAGEIEVEPKLEKYYELLNCNTIDIPERRIGDTYFDVICDDEGLLCESPKVSAVSSESTLQSDVMLVGNLLFCHHDGNGDETGLTSEDVQLLKEHLKWYIVSTDSVIRPVITGVEY